MPRVEAPQCCHSLLASSPLPSQGLLKRPHHFLLHSRVSLLPTSQTTQKAANVTLSLTHMQAHTHAHTHWHLYPSFPPSHTHLFTVPLLSRIFSPLELQAPSCEHLTVLEFCFLNNKMERVMSNRLSPLLPTVRTEGIRWAPSPCSPHS